MYIQLFKVHPYLTICIINIMYNNFQENSKKITLIYSPNVSHFRLTIYRYNILRILTSSPVISK